MPQPLSMFGCVVKAKFRLRNGTVKGTVTKSCLCKWTERVMGARCCLVFRRINYFFFFLERYNRNSVVILVIDKSDSRFAVVRFCQSLVWLQTELDSTPITVINKYFLPGGIRTEHVSNFFNIAS